jgi:MFS family permease
LGFAQSFAWMMGYLFGGRLTDRFGGARCLQMTCAIHALVMLPYAWATQGWMLLPSFLAAGIASAGIDLWVNYTIIELADPARIPDYTTLCSMTIGARGLLAPFVGAGLLRLGLGDTGLFILSASLTWLAALNMRAVILYPKATPLPSVQKPA